MSGGASTSDAEFDVKWEEAEFWPSIMQALNPTMDELGIPCLEEMGNNQPKLAIIDSC